MSAVSPPALSRSSGLRPADAGRRRPCTHPTRRGKRYRALLVTAVAALLLAPAAAPGVGTAGEHASLAAVLDCHTWASYPNVLISSARNMSCAAAAHDMKRYRRPIYRRFTTPGGF